MPYKYKLHPFFDDASSERPCDQEGCTLAGEFKAPRSRTGLRDYFWFCLEHVRDYNQRWDYFAGMNRQELEQEQRLDITWQRPSWPFAQRTTQSFYKDSAHIDPVNIFSKASKNKIFSHSVPPHFSSETEGGRALRVMNLEYPFTQKELKFCYIFLVKKYHPDIHKGCRDAEERLKEINRAYEILRRTFERN